MQLETVETPTIESSEVVQQEAVAAPEAKSETSEEVSETPEETLTPEERIKKLAKARERDKRKIGKLHAQSAQSRETAERLEKALEEITKRLPKETQPALDENKFDNYGEFLKADNKQTATEIAQKIVDEKLAAFQSQQQEQQKQVAWIQERTKSVDSETDKLSKELPDFDSVMQSNAETIQMLPPMVKLVALSIPNVGLAAYQLAKEDAIDELADMTPEQAKSALEQAVKRGTAAIQARKISKAPEPMAPARGAASATKSLDRMTAAELVQWARSG